MKDREKFVVVRPAEAERQLIEWLEDADLDDLARLLSLVCENGRVVVKSDFGKSDEFKDGKRCKVQINPTEKGTA